MRDSLSASSPSVHVLDVLGEKVRGFGRAPGVEEHARDLAAEVDLTVSGYRFVLYHLQVLGSQLHLRDRRRTKGGLELSKVR